MNNGYPPYGDPSQWGQQPPAGQTPPAQYTQGQYPNQQGGYQQSGAGSYQQPYAQSPYSQSGYSQGYQQQTYAQQSPQQGYQPQNYQQQTRQAQESYQQQSWQPYGQQSYTRQPYQQPYGQQAYQQPYGQPQGAPGYQQTMQNQQPLQQGYAQQEPAQGVFYPAQGYSGYVSTAKAKPQPSPLSGEVICKVALFGVLPVLFVLGIVLKAPVLCWLYVAGAALTVGAMWLKGLVEGNLRLAASLVCGVLAVVALATALGGAPAKEQADQQNGLPGAEAGTSGVYGAGLTMQETATPTVTPTLTPDPYAEASAAVEQLQSFFYLWHVNNDESMLALTAPSWRSSVDNPAQELFRIRMNRTPHDDAEIDMTGSEADSMRTAKVKVTIDKNNNRPPQRYAFNVIMLKEDGIWYVDPRSLESNEPATETTPATNPMPTQPVLNTGAPNLTLYYNPDGGTKYHIDPNCDSVHDRWKPLQGQFLFSQLNDAPYDQYEQCSVCGAPLREK